MRTSFISSAVAGAALFSSSAVAQSGAASTIDPLVIAGKHFFYKTNGSELYAKLLSTWQNRC